MLMLMQEVDARHERDAVGVPHLLVPDKIVEHGETREDVPKEVPAETADLGEDCRRCRAAIVAED
jgi:hypothetical protein